MLPFECFSDQKDKLLNVRQYAVFAHNSDPVGALARLLGQISFAKSIVAVSFAKQCDDITVAFTDSGVAALSEKLSLHAREKILLEWENFGIRTLIATDGTLCDVDGSFANIVFNMDTFDDPDKYFCRLEKVAFSFSHGSFITILTRESEVKDFLNMTEAGKLDVKFLDIYNNVPRNLAYNSEFFSASEGFEDVWGWMRFAIDEIEEINNMRSYYHDSSDSIESNEDREEQSRQYGAHGEFGRSLYISQNSKRRGFFKRNWKSTGRMFLTNDANRVRGSHVQFRQSDESFFIQFEDNKFDDKRCSYFNIDGMIRQRFTFRNTVMKYICTNMRGAVMFKLYQSCKWFFHKLRRITVKHLVIARRGEYEQLCLDETILQALNPVLRDNIFSPISSMFIVTPTHHFLYATLGLYVKKLVVGCYISWTDFENLTASGTIEEIEIAGIYAADTVMVPSFLSDTILVPESNTSTFAPLEDLLIKLPNATSIIISKCQINPGTCKSMLSLVRGVKMRMLYLELILDDVDNFDIAVFVEFVIKHADPIFFTFDISSCMFGPGDHNIRILEIRDKVENAYKNLFYPD